VCVRTHIIIFAHSTHCLCVRACTSSAYACACAWACVCERLV